jgi:hypothetical protein
MIDYQTILLWMAAEHKSQGGLMKEILSEQDRINEQYFYFAINQYDKNNTRLETINNLFIQLVNIHQA